MKLNLKCQDPLAQLFTTDLGEQSRVLTRAADERRIPSFSSFSCCRWRLRLHPGEQGATGAGRPEGERVRQMRGDMRTLTDVTIALKNSRPSSNVQCWAPQGSWRSSFGRRPDSQDLCVHRRILGYAVGLPKTREATRTAGLSYRDQGLFVRTGRAQAVIRENFRVV
jgi:hypothetical protein